MNSHLCDYESQSTAISARIERALVLLAYCIELDGNVHLPLYAKLEAELDVLQSQQHVRERARRRLGAYSETWLAEGDPRQELELQLK